MCRYRANGGGESAGGEITNGWNGGGGGDGRGAAAGGSRSHERRGPSAESVAWSNPIRKVKAARCVDGVGGPPF